MVKENISVPFLVSLNVGCYRQRLTANCTRFAVKPNQTPLLCASSGCLVWVAGLSKHQIRKEEVQ